MMHLRSLSKHLLSKSRRRIDLSKLCLGMIKNVTVIPAGLPEDVLHKAVDVEYCLHHHIILNLIILSSQSIMLQCFASCRIKAH